MKQRRLSAPALTQNVEIDMTTHLQLPNAQSRGKGRAWPWLAVLGPGCAALLLLAAMPAGAQPANDNFDAAELLIGDTMVGYAGDSSGATLEPGEPRHFGTGGSSIWYRWTATNSGRITFNTVGSAFDTVLVAYVGTNVATLRRIAGNDDISQLNIQSRISFSTISGNDYYIAVDGFNGASGPISLNWEPGDVPIAGTRVSAGEFNFSASLYTATEFESSIGPYAQPFIPRFDELNLRSPFGAVITVTRTGGSDGRVLVDFTTADDTGYAFVDYTPLTTTLVFDDFMMSTNFVIAVGSDFTSNGVKNVALQLSNPRADPEEEIFNPGVLVPTLGAGSAASLQILEIYQEGTSTNFNIERSHYAVDESRFVNGRRTGSLARVDVVLEGNGPGEVTYRTFQGVLVGYPLSAGSDYPNGNNDFVFPQTAYTDGTTGIVNHIDYTGQNTRLMFGVNQTRIAVTNVIFYDPDVEFNEDIYVWLEPVNNNPPLGANAESLITILNNDQPAGALDRDWNPDLVSSTTPRFNASPGANGPVHAVVVQADQRTIIGGDFNAYNADPRNFIARINQDGSLDQTFRAGEGADRFVTSLGLYPPNGPNGGKIVVGGGFTSFDGRLRNGVARLNADGSLDTGFSVGSGAQGLVWSVAVQSDGKVLVAGDFDRFNGVDRRGIVRLNNDGSVDQSFNPGSGADGPVYSVAVRDSQQTIFVPRNAEGNEFQDDNLIETGSRSGTLVVDFDFLTILDNIRVYYDGAKIFDVTTNGIGRFTVPFGPGNSTKILIVMNEGTGLSGTLWFYTATVTVPVLERKIFLGGDFLDFNGAFRGRVARLNEDGSLDLGYDAGGGADGPVNVVRPQPDGRLLLGGRFATVDFQSRPNLARLDIDGKLDLSFDSGSGPNEEVFAITVQPDSKALVGGLFTSVNGTRRQGLSRLFINGTVDTSFLDTAYNQFAGFPRTFYYEPANSVRAIAMQTNGDVMVGGSFTQAGGDFATEINSGGLFDTAWTRATKRVRHNVARLIGGYTPGPGNIEFVFNLNNVDEKAGAIQVPMQRIDGRLGTVTALATTSDRIATGGDDYSYVKTLVTWPEFVFVAPVSVGAVSERFVTIPIVNDTKVEGNEVFGASFRDPTGSITLGGEFIPLGAALGKQNSDVSVTDDDVNRGVIAFASPVYATNEGAGIVLISLVRTNGSSGPASVRYFTQNGTAASGQDFTGVSSGLITFGSGVTTAVISNILRPDVLVEADETYTITLTNASGASLPGGPGSTLSATVRIIDDDLETGKANFALTGYTTNENAGIAQISLERLGGGLGELSVLVGAFSGTAGSADFVAVTNVVTWVDQDVEPKVFPVALLNDSQVEGTETVTLRILSALSGGVGGVSNATLFIADDDAYGALSFSQQYYDTDERGTPATIVVTRTGGVGGTVSVDYVVTAGTAVPTNNFIPATGTLTFPPGVMATNFDVVIVNDLFTNEEHTVVLRLTNFVNASVGLFPVATLRISDDETVGDPAGSIDPIFSPLAGGTNSIYSVLVQPDGKVLVAGEFRTLNRVLRNRIGRLNDDGSLDDTFDPRQGPNSVVRAMALQPDGRILIGGFFDTVHSTNRGRIARLLPDGTIDAQFNPGAGADNPVYAVALDASGHVIIGGAFATVNGRSRPGIAMLNADGSVDPAFDPQQGANGNVLALAVQLDGKILVGGDFTRINGNSVPYLARLNPDGSVDASFNTGTGPDRPVRAIALQSDGRIYVGGTFTNYNGTARGHLARLLADGTLDTTFLTSVEGANRDVTGLALQFDNKLIVVGEFTSFNGVSRGRITRLLRNGKTDPTINFGEGANEAISTVAIQPDRKIIIGGRFTAYDGEARYFLARLFGGSIAGPGALEFLTPTFKVNEGIGSAPITVVRRGGTTAEITTDYFTGTGSATPGTDYTAVSGILTFPEGETRQTFLVPIVNDFVGEPNETVPLVLTNQSPGVAQGAVPRATLIILNDDSGVGFSSPTYTVSEGTSGGAIQIDVLRTGATNGTSIVSYATLNGSARAGSDYTAASGVLTFAPGVTLQSFSVSINNDTTIEPSETFSVILTNLIGSGAISIPAAVVTILDNDFQSGVLTFAPAVYAVPESAGSVVVTVLRTNGTTGVVTVDYATVSGTAVAGTDFTGSSGTLTFAEGQTSQTITIPILDDALVEGDEDFTVRLSSPGGGAQIVGSTNAIVSILDEEFGPGSVDRSFDPGAGANGLVRALNVQPSGKVLLGGAFTKFAGADRIHVARLQSDGSLDIGFNPGLGPNALVSAVVSGPVGKVVVGGAFDSIDTAFFNRVGRLNDDGSPDLTFSQNVGLNAAVYMLSTQTNGSILFGGAFSLPTRGVGRLQENGAVDSSFNLGVGVDGPVHCAIETPDGSIIIAGAFTAVNTEPHSRIARLTSSGLVDSQFQSGAIPDGTIFWVAVQSDGALVVAGDFPTSAATNRVRIARLNSDGSLDQSYNVGFGANLTVYAVGLQSDGKAVVAGDFTSVNGAARSRFARLNTDGSLDTSFDPGRGANNTVFALSVLGDDDILIAGDFTQVGGLSRPGVARIQGSDPGPVLPSFGGVSVENGIVRLNLSAGSSGCVLEASADLIHWTAIATNTATQGQFSVPVAPGVGSRFFRARELHP